jgi:cytidylate kinase
MRERGVSLSNEDVLVDVIRRDGIDGGRTNAPMRAARDAVIVNTDALGIDDVVDLLARLVAERAAAVAACRGSARGRR